MTPCRTRKTRSAAAGTRFTAQPALFVRDFTLMDATAGKEMESWMINAVWSGGVRSLWKARGGK
ncbi:MAG: hypothetical protein HZB23_00420 [Deltaproteobacteria bacterium]|nr:hypothetical protein [Deltaproteobacteria bacterium]